MTTERERLPGKCLNDNILGPGGEPVVLIDALEVRSGQQLRVTVEDVASTCRQGMFPATQTCHNQMLKRNFPAYAGLFPECSRSIQPNHILPAQAGVPSNSPVAGSIAGTLSRLAPRVSFRSRVRCTEQLPNSEIALYGCLMARMTPQEATAVNILLGYFAGRPELPPREIVRSLEILANRAHNRLQGGWDEVAVRRQWPYAYEDDGQERDSTGQDTENQV